jgi:hypothetical protein
MALSTKQLGLDGPIPITSTDYHPSCSGVLELIFRRACWPRALYFSVKLYVIASLSEPTANVQS